MPSRGEVPVEIFVTGTRDLCDQTHTHKVAKWRRFAYGSQKQKHSVLFFCEEKYVSECAGCRVWIEMNNFFVYFYHWHHRAIIITCIFLHMHGVYVFCFYFKSRFTALNTHTHTLTHRTKLTHVTEEARLPPRRKKRSKNIKKTAKQNVTVSTFKSQGECRRSFTVT